MDWLIDSTDAEAGSARARALLADHLSRHTAQPEDVEAALERVVGQLGAQLAEARGRPLHVHLDWTQPAPVLDLSVLEAMDIPTWDGVDAAAPIPARHRAEVHAWPHAGGTRMELPVARVAGPTFRAGPPPVLVDPEIDLGGQGPAAAALALTSAIEAHPSASAAQAAAIAGSILADAGLDGTDALRSDRVGEEFVRLHGLLGSDAYLVSADEDVVELAVAKCPFRPGKGGSSAICHLSSGLAGQIGARVRGAATVVLDETIVAGDPECHLQVLLREPEDAEADDVPAGEAYYWPPRTAEPTAPVPHLYLSVSLPRESVSVPVVRRLAAQALRAFGVHGEDVDDVQLAITEACGNVIDHAGETDTYDVKIELAADRCAITVIDQGHGFDATAVPSRPDDDSEVGRGLALMRALVDNVAFRNEPQAGAVVHMVKALEYDSAHPLRRG